MQNRARQLTPLATDDLEAVTGSGVTAALKGAVRLTAPVWTPVRNWGARKILRMEQRQTINDYANGRLREPTYRALMEGIDDSLKYYK